MSRRKEIDIEMEIKHIKESNKHIVFHQLYNIIYFQTHIDRGWVNVTVVPELKKKKLFGTDCDIGDLNNDVMSQDKIISSTKSTIYV